MDGGLSGCDSKTFVTQALAADVGHDDHVLMGGGRGRGEGLQDLVWQVSGEDHIGDLHVITGGIMKRGELVERRAELEGLEAVLADEVVAVLTTAMFGAIFMDVTMARHRTGSDSEELGYPKTDHGLAFRLCVGTLGGA